MKLNVDPGSIFSTLPTLGDTAFIDVKYDYSKSCG